MILRNNQYPSKEILLSFIHKGMTPVEISKHLNISVYKTKMALIHHSIFIGKTYEFICEGCGEKFIHFINGWKFCSNKCKHKYQLIWNRNKNKYNDNTISTIAKKMVGNKRWRNSEKLDNIYLPVHQITIGYNAQSSMEKEFLINADQDKEIVNIQRCNFSISYYDSYSKKQREYQPDFYLTFRNGAKWIVEIKGRLHLNELDKISAAQRYAKENGIRYRLITKGLVKYNTWNYFYYHTAQFVLPSVEYIYMSHAVATALFSSSHTRQVGAVMYSRDYSRILAFGYNGDEIGGTNIPDSLENGKSGFIHAEENVLIKKQTQEDAILFITDAPCEMCAKKIVNAGNIKEVYYLREYRDLSGVGILLKNGIKTYKFQLIDNNLTPLSDNEAFLSLCPAGMRDFVLQNNMERIKLQKYTIDKNGCLC